MDIRAVFALLLMAPAAAVAQQAQFCSVGRFGGSMNCSHASLDQCQIMARTMGGQCVIQTGGQQSRPQNFADAFNQGQQAGLAARESRARAALLEEQAEMLRQQRSHAPSGSSGYDVLFKCPTHGGGSTMTTTPAVGCVVVHVGPY